MANVSERVMARIKAAGGVAEAAAAINDSVVVVDKKVFLVKLTKDTDQGEFDEVIGIFTTKEKVEQAIRVHADSEGIALQPFEWNKSCWDGKDENYLSTFEIEGDMWPENSYTAEEFTLDSSEIMKHMAA